MNLTFKRFTQTNQKLKELLLLADPNEELIKKYLVTGIAYAAFSNQRLVGAFILIPINSDRIELANLAVFEEFQGQGVGKNLLKLAIEVATTANYQFLNVGTGTTSFSALALYQKVGFRIIKVEPNYFGKFYSQKLWENGIWLRDRLWLELSLIN